MNYFPLVSSIISAVFALLLAIQYRKRRKRHQLIWAISLFMFFLATLLEFLAEFSYATYPQSLGWSELTYKLYYVLSPVMVAFMGVGSLYLLAHVPVGKYFLYYTIALTVPLFVLGFAAPVGQTLQKAVAETGGTEIAGSDAWICQSILSSSDYSGRDSNYRRGTLEFLAGQDKEVQSANCVRRLVSFGRWLRS